MMGVGGASLDAAHSTSSKAVIHYVRSFFDENTSKSAAISEELLQTSKREFESLTELQHLHFQPKDIWGNREYVFGYGLLEDGSTVLFAWKNEVESPSLNLKDLSGIYEDDRLSSVQDEKDLKRWKKMRELVAGAFIGVRKSDLRYSSLYPPRDIGGKTGRASLEDLVLDHEPVVIKFSSNKQVKAKESLASSEDFPTR